MDAQVLEAMQKWPNVPAVKGWLELTQRGQWLIHPRGEAYLDNAKGEPIANEQLKEFINRNYAATQAGEWFFQNGPQRVFVKIDLTPWIVHLKNADGALQTHTGKPITTIKHLYISDQGIILFLFDDQQCGALLDKDLVTFMELLSKHNPELDWNTIPNTEYSNLRLPAYPDAFPLSQIAHQNIQEHFHFIAHP